MTIVDILAELAAGDSLLDVRYFDDGCVSGYSVDRADGGWSSFGLVHNCGAA